MSPGTTHSDRILLGLPSLRTFASSAEYSDRAYLLDTVVTEKGTEGTAIAFSALLSWLTPTIAFNTKIVRMTTGSTNAVKSFAPSTRANANEMNAEPSNISTN